MILVACFMPGVLSGSSFFEPPVGFQCEDVGSNNPTEFPIFRTCQQQHDRFTLVIVDVARAEGTCPEWDVSDPYLPNINSQDEGEREYAVGVV